MGDAYFVSADEMSALVGYLGQGFGIGLGVALALFVAGYGVYFLMDLFRGGL